jgi:phage terminase small subunit
VASNRLTEKQAAFAALICDGMPLTDAYLQAYGGNCSRKTAAVSAVRLTKHPLIAAMRNRRMAAAIRAVDVACERYNITADRVADEMARLAFTNLDQVADVRTVIVGGKPRQEVVVKDFSEIEPEARSAISEVKRGVGGELAVRLFNKREALMDLARLKGWIADKPIDQRNLVVLKVER